MYENLSLEGSMSSGLRFPSSGKIFQSSVSYKCSKWNQGCNEKIGSKSKFPSVIFHAKGKQQTVCKKKNSMSHSHDFNRLRDFHEVFHGHCNP